MPHELAIEENPALADETLIPMQDACDAFPVKVSQACLQRMIRKGTRGVRLETIFIANRRYTSREAIRRFIERTQNTSPETERPLPSRPATMTPKELEAARKKFNLPAPEGIRQGKPVRT